MPETPHPVTTTPAAVPAASPKPQATGAATETRVSWKAPRRIALAGVALAVLAAAAWWFTRAPLVPVYTLTEAPLLRTLQFSGRVATLSRVDVGSTLTARVAEVLVAQGDRVKQGAVLVRLESEELQATLDQARASQKQAQARLAGLRSTGRSAAVAAETQAHAVLVNARAELKRTEELVAKGFVSDAKADEARRLVTVAQAQEASARAQRMANDDPGTDVVQAQAQLAAATSATEAAQARLAQTRILAPADAVVLSRAVEPGQITQPGRALVSLALVGPMQLVAQVDERTLEQLQPGQSAGVVADAYPGTVFTATVLSVAPLVDTQRGAVEVKFTVVPPVPAFLREDMTLSIEVATARRAKALVLPLAALKDASLTQATVLVNNAGVAEARPVKLGIRTLAAVEVLEGLTGGEQVVVSPVLKAGQRLRPDTRAAALITGGSAQRQGTREDAGSAMTNAMGR